MEQDNHNAKSQNEAIQNESIVEELQEKSLKRSQRVKMSPILNDYVVLDFDIGTN